MTVRSPRLTTIETLKIGIGNGKEIVSSELTSISSDGTIGSTTSSSKNLAFMDSTSFFLFTWIKEPVSFSAIWISNEKGMTYLGVYLFLQGIINFYLSWVTLDLRMVQARFSSCPKFKRSFGNKFTRNSIQDVNGCFQGFSPK